jgi:hypothetical protein
MLRFVVAALALAALALAVTSGAASAQDEKTAPTEAKSTADILKAVEKIKGFGIVASSEFGREGERRFFVWYCPYSGRAACHFHGYTFDAKKERWIRSLDRVFEGTADVSIEVGRGLRIRDMKGQVVLEEKARD